MPAWTSTRRPPRPWPARTWRRAAWLAEPVQPLRFEGGALLVLDQRALPEAQRWIRCETVEEVADCIRALAVRGARAVPRRSRPARGGSAPSPRAGRGGPAPRGPRRRAVRRGHARADPLQRGRPGHRRLRD